jgi:hypothetical protein
LHARTATDREPGESLRVSRTFLQARFNY